MANRIVAVCGEPNGSTQPTRITSPGWQPWMIWVSAEGESTLLPPSETMRSPPGQSCPLRRRTSNHAGHECPKVEGGRLDLDTEKCGRADVDGF